MDGCNRIPFFFFRLMNSSCHHQWKERLIFIEWFFFLLFFWIIYSSFFFFVLFFFLNWVMEKSDTSAGEKRTNGILVWRIRHLKEKLTQEGGQAGQKRRESNSPFSVSLLKWLAPWKCVSSARGVRLTLYAAKLKDFLLYWRVVLCVCGGFKLQNLSSFVCLVVVRHAHLSLRGLVFFFFFCHILHIV